MTRYRTHPRGFTWHRILRVILVLVVLVAVHAVVTLEW